MLTPAVDERWRPIRNEAVDRHVAGGHGRRTAIRFRARDGSRDELSYGALADLSSRFADVLGALGVGAGERVFAFSGRVPALYETALGTLAEVTGVEVPERDNAQVETVDGGVSYLAARQPAA